MQWFGLEVSICLSLFKIWRKLIATYFYIFFPVTETNHCILFLIFPNARITETKVCSHISLKLQIFPCFFYFFYLNGESFLFFAGYYFWLLFHQKFVYTVLRNTANDIVCLLLSNSGPLQWILIDGFKVPEHLNILGVLNPELFLLWIIIG